LGRECRKVDSSQRSGECAAWIFDGRRLSMRDGLGRNEQCQRIRTALIETARAVLEDGVVALVEKARTAVAVAMM
jgi:hypothetical protein